MSENNNKPVREIGYSKPPINTRFPKGVSGNPTGRPKGKLNVGTLLRQELQKKTIVKSKDGVRKEITKAEAIVERVVAKAMDGDPTAIRMTLNLMAMMEDSSSDGPKMSFNNSNQLLEEKVNTASNPGGYRVPDPVLARRTLALLQFMYGVEIGEKDPILVITNEQAKQLAIKVSKIYGFPVSAKEAVRQANDGILIKISEAETKTSP
jgi:hypothetical protein